jgi:hypothetical protein
MSFEDRQVHVRVRLELLTRSLRVSVRRHGKGSPVMCPLAALPEGLTDAAGGLFGLQSAGLHALQVPYFVVRASDDAAADKVRSGG